MYSWAFKENNIYLLFKRGGLLNIATSRYFLYTSYYINLSITPRVCLFEVIWNIIKTPKTPRNLELWKALHPKFLIYNTFAYESYTYITQSLDINAFLLEIYIYFTRIELIYRE